MWWRQKANSSMLSWKIKYEDNEPTLNINFPSGNSVLTKEDIQVHILCVHSLVHIYCSIRTPFQKLLLKNSIECDSKQFFFLLPFIESIQVKKNIKVTQNTPNLSQTFTISMGKESIDTCHHLLQRER